MSQSQIMNEKREFSRISKEIPIEVSELSYPISQDPGKKCLCKNISGGGICFISSKPYKIKALLSLSMHIIGWQSYKKPFSLLMDMSTDTPLTAIGEVAWCKQLPDDDSQYDVGIKFLNIYEDDYYALMKYLEDQ